MNTVRVVALSLVLASPSFAQTSQPAADPLSTMSWLLGSWRLQGQWANGTPIVAEANYFPLSGGKFLAASTMVSPPDGGAMRPRDFVVYGMQEGRLAQWTFAQDGSVRVVPATPTDDSALLFEWTKPGVDGKPPLPLRLRISRDGERLRWQQFTQLKGEWHSTLDGRFERYGAASIGVPATTPPTIPPTAAK